MNYQKILHLILMPGLVGSLLACSPAGSEDVAGIDGTGSPARNTASVTSAGTIDGFGSIIINGVRYETDEAMFILDDEAGMQSDLAVGQVIVLKGEINADGVTGVASEVIFNTNVAGLVSAVDQADLKFTVLGQTIVIDESTRFDGIDVFTQLASGQTVKVSGFWNSNNEIVATHIIVSAVAVPNEVTGIIDNLDNVGMTFQINDLEVDYSGAVINGELTNGQFVEVKGTLNIGNSFIATEVNVIELQIGNEGQLVELEGLVTNFNSITDFQLNSVAVVTDGDTQYENGSAIDVTEDVRLEAEGTLDENGILVADTIIIIQTAPQIFSGSLNQDNTVTYTVETSAEDRALWVRVTSATHYLSMYVNENEPLTDLAECVRLKTLGGSGFCYLENTSASTWYITLDASFGLDVDYEISVFSRRAPFSNPVEITLGENVAVNASVGDRKVFTLPASGPDDDIFAVALDGADTGDFFYVKADEPPSISDYDCRFKMVSHEEPVCRLKNENVGQWFMMLESAANTSYTLRTDYINPVPISNGQSISDTLTAFDKDIGVLYKLPVNETDVSVAASLTNILVDPDINGERQYDLDQIELRIMQDVESWRALGMDCLSRQTYDYDEQCIDKNEHGDAPWYILVTGKTGTHYTATGVTQTQRPDVVAINLGDNITVNQAAGVQALYSLPAGTPGNVLTAILKDTTATFDLYADPNSDLIRWVHSVGFDCMMRAPNMNACRLVNDDPAEPMNLLVQGASAGQYTLSVSEQPLTLLSLNTPLQGTMSQQDAIAGKLYRVDVPANNLKTAVEVTNQSLPVDLRVGRNAPPIDIYPICTSDNSGTQDERCLLNNDASTSWYILVTGEENADFTLSITQEPK